MNYEGLAIFSNSWAFWAVLTPMALLNVGFRAHFLLFVRKYAVQRPINVMFIFDQVIAKIYIYPWQLA